MKDFKCARCPTRRVADLIEDEGSALIVISYVKNWRSHDDKVLIIESMGEQKTK